MDLPIITPRADSFKEKKWRNWLIMNNNMKVRAMEQRLCDWPAGTDGAPRAISRLEGQIEEQKQLRLQDAKQVEAKAARIKEWVTNKLRELEQQNQQLREQNDRCNQQLELLRNHIAAQGTRNSAFLPSRASLSLEVREDGPRATSSLAANRRRSESLEGPQLPLNSTEPHYSTPVRHRRNLSIGTTNLTTTPPAPVNLNTMNRTMDERTTASLLADDLAAAVENLVVLPTTPATSTDGDTTPRLCRDIHAQQSYHCLKPLTQTSDFTKPSLHPGSYHSLERTPAWSEAGVVVQGSRGSSEESVGDPRRPPTPPLHRLPSWEAKIYQVADDGLQQSVEEQLGEAPSARPVHESTSYQDMSVPVYATVKGRASQIRSMPFTGESSDDSSDGEDSMGVTVHNTPNHVFTAQQMPLSINNVNLTCILPANMQDTHARASSTHCSSSDASLGASSPSKSVNTSSSLSPAKRSSSGSPTRHKHTHTSFESGMSDDYAIPPDALSCDTSASPSLPSLGRAQHADSPRRHDALEKSGHLAKLGGKLKTWRKRWFVLKNGTLSYWKSQWDVARKPAGQVGLGEACRISRNEGAATFEIYTGARTYYLAADSAAAMDDWIRVLQWDVARKPAGQVGLGEACRISRNEGAATFEIYTGARTYYLAADSAAAMDDWIRVLQNVQRRNATKLLLSKEDNKPTIQGWLTKVKNGHAKKSWCVLIGKMFLYFKSPGDQNPIGQINMRDARVEDVEHSSDSDSEEKSDEARGHLTAAIYPQHQEVSRCQNVIPSTCIQGSRVKASLNLCQKCREHVSDEASRCARQLPKFLASEIIENVWKLSGTVGDCTPYTGGLRRGRELMECKHGKILLELRQLLAFTHNLASGWSVV
ncbi:unnamed protein product [Plutella xylostella]|uniref:(diamondback moth) hypothetical protein n=1 Tax=Plutella xylostella TaxID=51655 RepID=A0A8S4F855_PLUXY|nr:unnamed protein product [Plutella xylostella]